MRSLDRSRQFLPGIPVPDILSSDESFTSQYPHGLVDGIEMSVQRL
ncbi:hypothetical protein [Actinoallomurus sp. NPDC050550]